ncbi:MAG: domain S-box protein [Mucilaginibacter sp.]|nr:domain S-box protein [Mucilaginibacter sp.]
MHYSRRRRIISIISLLTVFAGITVITGWIFDIPALQSIIPGFEGMRFNAALCFVLFSVALLISQYQTRKYSNLVFFVLSFLGFLIGLITLSQDLFHYNSGLDQLFVTDGTIPSYSFPFPGRMAFNASVNFLFLGLGFLALVFKKRLFNILSQFLFHIVTILSAVALIGYLYGVSFFRALLYQTSMATHTAILFFFFSLAASLVNPTIGIAKLFTGNRVGNQMAKKLYALMILMVIVFGSLRFQTQRFHLFSSLYLGVSLLAVSFLLVSLVLIWHTANWLNSIDEQRSKAEAEVKLMNADLEKRVEERSAEIQKSEEKYRSLIEQASDAIFVLDYKRNFTEVNASTCKMIGYNKEELLRLNVEAVIDPEELKTIPLAKDVINNRQSIIRERRYMRKDGSIFTVEVNVKGLSDDRIMVIARDITSRKKMETELKEAELKFRTIADKSIVGVYMVQNGKFIYVNPRFADVFGYEPEELINTFPVETIIHESYRSITTENMRQRIEGEVESIHYEALGKKKDGTANWLEFYGSRAIIGEQPTIIGSMIDITERKKAEEELRSSEHKYKLLFESNPMPLWMIAKDNLSIIDVNDAAAELYGYTRDELLNMSVKDLRLNVDLEQQLEGYSKKKNHSTGPNIVRHLKKDGTVMFVQIIANDIIFESRPVRLSLTNDITEKLRAEESLQKSEANLQTILNTTDTAYALFDTDLKVLAFNQKAREFVNRQYNHVPEKGDRLVDFFSEDRFPQFISFTKNVLKGNNINFEMDYSQADGSVLWYYVRLFPITDDKKEILGILIALYNITERKNAEQDLKCAYERIQCHINSIKDMAWKQSHLIRSPLANLKGLTAILKDGLFDTEVLDHIQTELNRMDAIIIEMAKDASNQNIHD